MKLVSPDRLEPLEIPERPVLPDFPEILVKKDHKVELETTESAVLPDNRDFRDKKDPEDQKVSKDLMEKLTLTPFTARSKTGSALW